MTRNQRRVQFAKELYLQASFFNMKTVGSSRVDRFINVMSDNPLPLGEMEASRKLFPPKEVMPKFPKGK